MALRVDQIFNQLRFNTQGIFDVTFERRTTRRDGTAVAGDLRQMIAYGGGVAAAPVQLFKRGIIPDAVRDAQDFRHAILTVWSLDECNRLLAQGIAPTDAAWRSWRRIDLCGIRNCSVIAPADLPPTIRNNIHTLTNAYRLANMPQAA